MSQENVEAIRAMWPTEAVELVGMFQRLDPPPRVVAAMGADTEVMFRPIAPGADNATFHGLEGFAEGWRDWLEAYETYWLEVEEFIDAGGDNVLMPARVQARTRHDGVLIQHAPAAVCTLSGGKITRLVFYLDRAEALVSVGLED